MLIEADGAPVFYGNGGHGAADGAPLVVFLHGSGLDHSVWALHSRWFAHHGWRVMAPDLPGHGRSGGAALESIEAMADWTAALIETADAPAAKLIGHSMGAMIALETAARHADIVSSIGLIGAAAAMPVSRDLLAAAEANDHAAVDMVSIWGNGFRAGLGGSRAPGLWMTGGAERVLERAKPGVLFRDLSAANAYQDGMTAAAGVLCPATIVLGERDMMTPSKAGRALAAAIKGSKLVVLPGAGHMLISERPDEVLDALKG